MIPEMEWTDAETIRQAARRVVMFGESPEHALAFILTRRIIFKAAEEFAVANLILSA